MLKDKTEYLAIENLIETANNLSKVLFLIQSTKLSCKLKVPGGIQSKVTDFFMIPVLCFKNNNDE